MLPALPDEVIYNIFSFLNTNQLLPLRLVCRRTKQCVDFALGSKKCVFKVTKKDQQLSRLQWRVSIFKSTRKLHLEKPSIRADLLRLVFMGKFTKLKAVQLLGSKVKENDNKHKLWPSNLHFIGECFPNIKQINFGSTTVDDDSLTKLFSLCQKLSIVSFLNCNGSKGNFLRTISKKVGMFSWCGNPFNPNELQISNLHGFGEKIHHFVYDCMLEDDFGIQTLVAKELKNLNHLSLSVKDLRLFSQFSLRHLTSIMLFVDNLSGSLKLREPCLETKAVIVDVQSLSGDASLADLISNFPNAQKLKIWLTKGNEIVFDEALMNEITSLKSLQFFQFADDESGTKKYMTLNDGTMRNAFVETVRKLDWVSQMILFVVVSKLMKDELIKIAAERPNQSFPKSNIYEDDEPVIIEHNSDSEEYEGDQESDEYDEDDDASEDDDGFSDDFYDE